jgi:pimeloyl-ACP methyl ester carboxylesterase
LPVVLEQRRARVAAGVSLAARAYAPTAAGRPTVVLVHGLASTSRLWDGVAERLAACGHPVMAVDLRGHGESDAPDDGYDTATAADDLIAFLELGEVPVVLAGQSWGGNVVLQLAARRRDLVAGLALVDGGWISLRSRFSSWESALRALTPPPIDGLAIDDFRAMVAESLAGFPDGAVDAATSVVRVLDDQTIERRLTVGRHLQILRSMWDDEPAQWYPHIETPTLLMPALADDHLPDEVAAAANAIRGARVRAYPGAHHDVHLQRPGEVATDIRRLT